MTRIRNIVLAAPDGQWTGDRWEGGQRALAQFYADLLGWTVIREDWPVVARDAESLPRLAFGDGPSSGYVPPRWPDPEFPIQVHLDFATRDLEIAEQHALAIGATKLHDAGSHRVYADPVGHPFCTFAIERAGEAPLGPPLIVAFNTPGPRALANFYAELLEMRDRLADDPKWVMIRSGEDRDLILAFQYSTDALPRWPDPRYPQQTHLDLDVEDAAQVGEVAERLGAIRLEDEGGSCAVYADPSAHPFCLCEPGQ